MIRCIAIDDEPLALQQLSGYVEKTPFLHLVEACPNALVAMQLLQDQPVDLMFVDIDMPDLNGLDFVRSLVAKPMLVFTTAYSEYALEGFRVDALDYLLKPIGYADFLRAAEKAYRHFKLITTCAPSSDNTPGYLFVKSDYKRVQVSIMSITHIEGYGEYVRIYTDTAKPVMTLMSMKALEEYLPLGFFMRVHRSYIIRLDKIIEVERAHVVLSGGVRIPLGDQYKEAFKTWLDQHSLLK